MAALCVGVVIAPMRSTSRSKAEKREAEDQSGACADDGERDLPNETHDSI
jgi:hypothetical protein